MTLASDIHCRVLDLDAQGEDPEAIATQLGIPVARVDRILESTDVPHNLPEPLEPAPKAPKRAPERAPRVLPTDRRFTVDLPPTRDICGSLTGYWKHRKEREKPCRPCLTAYNEHQGTRERGGPNGRPQNPIVHGTPAGRQAERRRGLPVCDPCRLAFNADRLARKKAQRERAS